MGMGTPDSGRGTDAMRDELLAQRTYVRALARRLVLDPDRADDVAQDALLAALEACEPPPRAALRRWLSVVVRNLAWRALRGEARRKVREITHARRRAGSAAADPADAVGDLQLHREVVDALLALDEPYRTTLVLHFFEGLAPREIAQRTHIAGATVRSHLRRGLAKLRATLDARHAGDRRTWMLALLPLAFPSRTATAAGAALMSTKPKLAVAALLLLACGGVTLTLVARGDPGDAPARTALRSVTAADAAEDQRPADGPAGLHRSTRACYSPAASSTRRARRPKARRSACTTSSGRRFRRACRTSAARTCGSGRTGALRAGTSRCSRSARRTSTASRTST
jgi:RNA polymerase sigma-70 factor (ECF subfamily)